VRKSISIATISFLVLSSINWQGTTQANSADSWVDITSSPAAEPVAVSANNFNRFLSENVEGIFSTSTLEWLSLAPREAAYQSWYLGIINGYHLFTIQVSGDFDFNLYVFDQDGRLRDKREVLWGNDGGSVDLIDQKMVQIKRYLAEDIYAGMEEINLQIDINGQFLQLEGPEYFSPKRKYPQSSATVLASDQLSEYSIDDLEYMRNELLASTGFIFKNKEVQHLFEEKSWYIPATNSIKLTSLEEYNLLLLEQVIATK